MTISLDNQKVAQIKERLWNGDPQHHVAMEFNVSQPTISRIVNGTQWFHVPWPDGSVGGFPVERRLEIQEGRISRQKRLAPTIPPEEVEQLGDNIVSLVLRRVNAAAEAAEDADLLEILQDHGISQAEFEGVKANPPAFDPLKWKYLKGKKIAIVEAADKSGDEKKMAIVTYVLEQLPEDMWDSDIALKLVKEALEITE